MEEGVMAICLVRLDVIPKFGGCDYVMCDRNFIE